MNFRALPAFFVCLSLAVPVPAKASDRYAIAAGKANAPKVEEIERNIETLNRQLRQLEQEAAKLRGETPGRVVEPPAAPAQGAESAAVKALREEKLKEENLGKAPATGRESTPATNFDKHAPREKATPAQPPASASATAAKPAASPVSASMQTPSAITGGIAASPIVNAPPLLRDTSRAMAVNKWEASSQALFPSLPIQPPLPEPAFRPQPGSLSQTAKNPATKDFSVPEPSPVTRAMAASPDYFPSSPAPGAGTRYVPPTTGPTRAAPAPGPNGRAAVAVQVSGAKSPVRKLKVAGKSTAAKATLAASDGWVLPGQPEKTAKSPIVQAQAPSRYAAPSPAPQTVKPEPQGRVVQPRPVATAAPSASTAQTTKPEPQGRVVQPTQAAKPTQPGISAQEGYDQALALYNARRFKESEAAFKEFLKRWPQSKLAPNAYYWLGETFYGRGDYSNAIFAFKDVQSRFPESSKVPDSLLKTAMCYSRLGDEANAALHVAVLYEDWPQSPATRQAKAKGMKAL